MNRFCSQCSTAFEITNDDLAFYDRVSPVFNGKKEQLPPPELCPDCRVQERLVWRAELHVFSRKSDLSRQHIFSYFPPDAPCVVWSMPEWLADNWNPIDYGRPYDFTRPFFDQFQDLMHVVPQPAASVENNENCDFINSASWCKNCYLLAGANHNEDCYYGNFVNHSKTCVDCNFVDHCELCYECIDCTGCYDVRYGQDCSNCSESAFLFGCRNSRNCFGAVNLVGKQYVFFNEQLTKDEYEKRMAGVELHHRNKVEEMRRFFETHRLRFPHRHMLGEMNENVSGNSILRSRNALHCFDVSDVEECNYCSWFHKSKNCMDCYSWGFTAEECYSCMEVGGGTYHALLSSMIYGCSDTLYCWNCRSGSKNIFGCVGLKRKEYCIFNKQYSKEEYEALVPKIIEHMQQTGEWGQFFPISVCPLAYNQTIANDYFPLNKVQATALGARWHDEAPVSQVEASIIPPDSILDCDASICDRLFTCVSTGKSFKIVPQEFAFYVRQKIPVPEKSFFTRHQDRLKKRNPRKLWNRACMKCDKKIDTPYAPDRPEIVYCETCYLETVY
jgi:hypothetical protein